MLDLSEAKKLMHERDCSSLIGRPEEKMYMYLGLADEVPGLVGEVETLRAEVEDVTSKLEKALHEKERWRLRAEAAERGLEGTA